MIKTNQPPQNPGRFTQMKELSLQHGRFSFDATLRAIVAQINSYEGNSSLLPLSGIDDVFYRTLALTLYPEKFLEQSERSSTTVSTRHVSRVCEYVMANISRPITLTELEQLAHMSRRALHNAFQTVYRQSPMEWVREQRLLASRALLHKPNGIQTVTQALYACGFTNPSLFASLYLRRFGESPSVTLKRSLGSP
jgi:AraC-like DNA-binding protein